MKNVTFSRSRVTQISTLKSCSSILPTYNREHFQSLDFMDSTTSQLPLSCDESRDKKTTALLAGSYKRQSVQTAAKE